MTTELDDMLAMAVFAEVAECGSFTTAAARLGLSKSVVSARVAALEARLGVKLLHRTTRRVTVTTEGEPLYARAAELLRVARTAAAAASDMGTVPEGTLRLAAPVGFATFKLVPLLPELTERHPRIRLELQLSDHTIDLVADAIDLAVRFAVRLDDSSLVARRIGSDRRVLCASPAYLARRGTPRTPEDLAAHDLLAHSTRRDATEWAFQGPSGPISVSVPALLSIDNVVVLRAAVLEGIGIASMPMSVVDHDVAAGRLLPVLTDHPGPEVGMYAVHPHGRHPPARVRAVIEFLAEHFG